MCQVLFKSGDKGRGLVTRRASDLRCRGFVVVDDASWNA